MRRLRLRWYNAPQAAVLLPFVMALPPLFLCRLCVPLANRFFPKRTVPNLGASCAHLPDVVGLHTVHHDLWLLFVVYDFRNQVAKLCLKASWHPAVSVYKVPLSGLADWSGDNPARIVRQAHHTRNCAYLSGLSLQKVSGAALCQP